MNTTAHIRSKGNKLNHHFIVSKTFVEKIDLNSDKPKAWGTFDLKGKGTRIELFSLKI